MRFWRNLLHGRKAAYIEIQSDKVVMMRTLLNKKGIKSKSS
jgi:translation initiation factor 1 (eIF-1/SUI1)